MEHCWKGYNFTKKFWFIVQNGIWMFWEQKNWKKLIFGDILGKGLLKKTTFRASATRAKKSSEIRLDIAFWHLIVLKLNELILTHTPLLDTRDTRVQTFNPLVSWRPSLLFFRMSLPWKNTWLRLMNIAAALQCCGIAD